jgi:hypothetical protein
VDIAAPHDDPAVLLAGLMPLGLLVGHRVLACGAAGPGKWAAGCSPLPLRAPCAAVEAQGQGIRAEKFLGERSGPERGAQEVCDPLDAECGRAKLGASSTAPPQAGPLKLLGQRGLEREPNHRQNVKDGAGNVPAGIVG